MVVHDLSKLDEKNKDEAVRLFARTKFLDTTDTAGNFRLALKPDHRLLVTAGNMGDNIKEFWLHFSLAMELLAKSALLKQRICILEKKAIRNFLEPRAFSSFKIKADSNHWLQSEFSRLGIGLNYELSTCTIGKLYCVNGHFDSLKNTNKVTQVEIFSLRAAFERLAFFRRNRDFHFHFMSNNFIDNNDIEGCYIPAANLLHDIYNR